MGAGENTAVEPGTPGTEAGDGRPRDDRAPSDGAPSGLPSEVLARALDGATGDYAVSGDAMRWSPDLAEQPVRSAAGSGLPGLDAATGLGSVLGLDAAGMRRLVSGALFSLTTAATDVVHELRQLTRGPFGGDGPSS